MLDRVRAAIEPDRTHDETWHILRVLDWDADDIREAERTSTRRWKPLGDAVAQLPYDVNGARAARTTALRRLRRALSAFESAVPDLDAAAACYSGLVSSTFNEDVRRGRAVLELAISDLEQVENAHRSVDELDRNRKTEHVRAAAMRILIDMHRFPARNAAARLAELVVNRNANRNPPCPQLAESDAVPETIRQALSRTRL
jgi:hypothetical protein